MTDTTVTITEIDNEAWATQDYPGFDDWSCGAAIACGEQAIGGYLEEDPSSGGDRPTFRTYWEITTTYPNTAPDVLRVCEDDLIYLTDIAPALVAFTATERST
jgi:hypothetical protein